ncbi:hypothetical protein QQ045_012920 [Rhodiola kirilowii]
MDKVRLEEEVDSIIDRMDEKLVVSFEDSDWRRMSEEGKWAIVVKLANGMPFNIKGLANILTKIWNMENRVSFVELANNMALSKFKIEVGATLNDKEYGEKLAGNIRKFMKVSQSDGARKRYIRVRVEVEIDKPLLQVSSLTGQTEARSG